MLLGLLVVPQAAAATEPEDHPVVVAVGDIACDPKSPTFNNGEGTKAGCRQKAVGQAVAAANPDAFLAAGDIQYSDGRMEALLGSYDKAFGVLKDKTYPVPGDHDYLTPKGADYYKYFGEVAHQEDKGTYAFTQGDWLIMAINTINCSPYYPCDEGSWTQRWIAGTLAANPAKCVMAYWHHPIWSGGEHGNFAPGVPIWNQLYDAGVDVVVTGNNHLYQRFHPLGRATVQDLQVGPPQLDPNGMVEFVVGTGGVDNHQATKLDSDQFKGAVAASGTDVVNGVFGALKMTLKPDSYDFEFLPAAGTQFTDSGSRGCRTKNLPTDTPPQINKPTVVRSGDGSATVSWPQPRLPASTPAVSYKVQALGTTKTCTTAGTSCKVTGLTNGQSYKFRVVASNAKALTNGDYADPMQVGKVSSRPQNVSVMPRPSAALVSWDAPADNGGLPISGYQVTAAPGGRTCTTTGERTCLVPNLTVGTKYTFSVRATNAAGTSSSSNASSSVVIPAKAPPGPPRISAMRRAGDGMVGVTVAPSDLPGSVTTSIKVTAAPTGRTCTVTLPNAECVVSGLTNGSPYTFTAKATGPDGISVASPVSESFVPARRPQRPVNATATALGGGDAQIAWDAPAWDGGMPITQYRVSGASGKTCTTDGATRCMISGLTPGTKYTWSVVAVNAAGTSETSVGTPTITAMGATRPGMPTVTKAERAGDGKAKVTVAAGRDNGLPQRIVVRADVKRASGEWERVATRSCTITAPAVDCTMIGLTNGLYYRFLAEASNTLGATALSAPGEPLQVGKNPGRPQNLAVTALPGGEALVTWTAPATDGGLPITSYTANTTVGKLSCKTTGELQCTLKGLEAGKTYTVIASATNDAGVSLASLTGPTVTGMP
jgi:hypothetical protein